MRNLFLASILVLTFCICSFAQTDKIITCPTLKIDAPKEVQRGLPVTFEAYLENNQDIKNYSLKWTVNKDYPKKNEVRGIYDAQLKREEVTVETDDTSGLLVEVEARNFPEGCKNIAIAQVITYIADPIYLTVYGKIPFIEEKAHIDTGIPILKEHKDLMFVFMVYYTKKDSIDLLKKRLTNIGNYLTKTHGLSSDKVKFIFGESDSYQTSIYLPPSSAFSEFVNWEESIKNLKSQNQKPKKTIRKTIKRKS